MGRKRRSKATVSDRVAEYANTSRLRRRVKVGNRIYCTVDGNYGTYQTRVVMSRSQFNNAECTCPSEYWPCKHVQALSLTYRQSPKSFVDIDRVLSGLKSKSREELVKVIRKMVVATPACLGVLGIKGFKEKREEEEEESW